MLYQSAGNVVVALARQADIETPAPSGPGAERFRLTDSQGLNLQRANIESQERPEDQIRRMGRLGGKTGAGVLNSEVNPGSYFDLLIESIARGTWGTLQDEPTISTDTQLRKVESPAIPVYTSYTIEQHDVDIAASEIYTGVRLTELAFSGQPNQVATCGWTFMGLDRQLDEATAPYFTNPNTTDSDPLIIDDASITYKGSLITTLTGIDLSFVVDAALQPVIGSFVGPDVFMNLLNITGQISAIRGDLLALQDYDDETEFGIQVLMTAPGTGARLTFVINLPRVKIMGVEAPVQGGDAAKVERRTISAHAPDGASNAVEFYSSTETPTPFVGP